MSINVTVKGNPVSIRHGKMVTATGENAKNEFDKRRKIRLEQVRQQSKEIARDVRNRVRKEKDKQLSQIEQEGARKLKQWQNKKLLQLQEQYDECLKDIGLGHLQASREVEKEEVEEARKEANKQVAKDRGWKAAQHLQAEKNQKSIQKAIVNQQKTLARDIENTRAAMVSKLNKASPKKSKTKKKFKDTTTDSESNDITLDISASDSDIPLLLNISSSDSFEMRSPKKQARKSSPKAKKPPKARSPEVSSASRLSDMSELMIKSAGVQTEPQSVSYFRDVPDSNTASAFPFETRISDRIRSRRLPPTDDPYDCCKENQAYTLEKHPSETRIPASSKRTSDPQYSSATKVNFLEDAKLHPEKYCGLSAPCKANREVPYKPHTIHLKPIREESGSGMLSTVSGQGKAQFYDHSNRYSREFNPDPSLVQRIPESSVVLGPLDNTESEFQQMMFRRDQDAIRRGNKALEKEKIQKDYEEMMRKLPVLKKQEKIATVGQKKDEFHMSDERLKQRERKRQNRMSNAYEKQFPLANEITLPKIQHLPNDSPNIAYKTVDLQNDHRGLNVASWDVPRAQACTPDCTSGLGQQYDLKMLLDKLREQREKLVNEVENVPLNSDLYKILDDLGVLDELQNKEEARKSNKRKHEHTELAESSSSGSLDNTKQKASSSKARSPKRDKHKKPKRATSEQPRKHSSFDRVLVLQNMSTQTSPKPVVEKAVSPVATPKTDKEICTCSPKKSSNEVKDTIREELCEIVIKIKEDDPPEIKITSPKKKDGSVKVIRNEAKTKSTQVEKSEGRTSMIDLGKLSKSYSDIMHNVEKGRRVSEYTKPTSWGEHLQAMETEMPSTTTSYYSPPDAHQPPKDGNHDSSSNARKQAKPKPKNNFADWLKTKPQQGNISQSPAMSSTPSTVGNKTLDPRLKVYIRKLLKMSPNSIAELSVTSTSDISTPGSSVFDNTRNEPSNQLRNVMKFFNLNPEDILGILNESDGSEQGSIATPRAQENGSEETGSEVHRVSTQRFEPQTEKFRNVVQQEFFGTGMAEARLPESNVSQKASPLEDILNIQDTSKDTAQITLPNESGSDARKMTLSDYSSKNYSEVIDKYSEIAENCHKRIMSLEKMINKIRKEKKEMLDTSPRSESDKDISVTAYKELPSHLGESRDTASSPDDTDQDHLTRQLLRIDFNLEDKLKKLKELGKAEVQSKEESSQTANLDTSIDRDLLQRYKDLLEPKNNQNTDTKSDTNDTIGWLTVPETTFVPFLLNIPRLPKFNVDNELKPNGTLKKRPPPAKALIVARKFNENIAATQPHELSTIIEADSHISAKPEQAKIREISPDREKSKSGYTSSVELEASTSRASSGANSAPEILMEMIKNAVQSVQNMSTSSKKKSPRKSKSAPIKIDSEASSSRSDLETVETMLQTLGMGWAVTTLRKTQQALAQTSSTSSLDISVKKVESSNSSSEISLHGVLQKNFMTKLSSNSSDSDILNLMKEFGDISAIHGSISTGDNRHHRTSTPVLASKSTSKSKSNSKLEGLVSGDSDISSIKPNEENFASIAVDSSSTILSQND